MSMLDSLRYDEAAHAYLTATNDLLEEIETRGYVTATANKLLTKEAWAALHDEWMARQAVLDAGVTGNYAEVVRNSRNAAMAFAVAGLTFFVAAKAYSVYVERAEDKRRADRIRTRAARLAKVQEARTRNVDLIELDKLAGWATL